MLLTIQFPLADCRLFIPSECGLLRVPQWPAAVPDTDFVRGFGAVRRRRAGGLDGWVGENVVCEAGNALRLLNAPRQFTLDYKGTKYVALQKVVFRRFFADGFSVAKFEVGYQIVLADAVYPSGVIEALLRKICNSQVSVAIDVNKRTEVALIRAGKSLAQSYRRSTTKATFWNDASIQPWWVTAGLPVVLFDYSTDERVKFPYPGQTLPIRGGSGADLSLFHVPLDGKNLAVWTLESSDGQGTVKAETRAFRICLLRLHAEREVLRTVLRLLGTQQFEIRPRSPESDALQYYFNEVTRRLTGLAKKADEIADTTFADLARRASEAFEPGELNAVLLTLKNLDMRLSITLKVEQVIQTQINNYGPMSKYEFKDSQIGAVGDGATSSNNVFNQWKQTSEGADLKSLAEQLAQLRAELKKQATAPEHDSAIAAIAEAETEAKKGDGPKTFEALKRAGKWVFDVAKELGVALAVEALKTSAGF